MRHRAHPLTSFPHHLVLNENGAWVDLELQRTWDLRRVLGEKMSWDLTGQRWPAASVALHCCLSARGRQSQYAWKSSRAPDYLHVICTHSQPRCIHQGAVKLTQPFRTSQPNQGAATSQPLLLLWLSPTQPILQFGPQNVFQNSHQ